MRNELKTPLEISIATLLGASMFFGFYPSVREWVTKEKLYNNGEKAVYALVAGGLSLGISSLLQRPLQRVQRRMVASEDMNDQILVQRQWTEATQPHDEEYREPTAYLPPATRTPMGGTERLRGLVTPLQTITYRSNPVAKAVVESDLSSLIVAPTGSGKTTMLFTIICEALNKGYKVIVFDGKPMSAGQNKYLGFGDKIEYIPLELPEHAPHFVQRLESLANDIMAGEPPPSKVLVIIDELNNAITKSNLYVTKTGSKNKEDQLLTKWSKIILTQGREKGYVTVGTTHDAGTKALDMSTDERNNFKFVVLGSARHRDTIEGQVKGAGVKLILDDKERDKLLKEYRDGSFDNYHCLTNVISGSWEFVVTDNNRTEVVV